jgi:hypothetical protein
MIWLLPHPLPPLPPVSDTGDIQEAEKYRLLDRRRGRGMAEEPNHTTDEQA